MFPNEPKLYLLLSEYVMKNLVCFLGHNQNMGQLYNSQLIALAVFGDVD